VKTSHLYLSQPFLASFLVDQGWGWILLFSLSLISALVFRNTPIVIWCMLLSGTIFILYARVDWMPRYRLAVPMLPFLALFFSDSIFKLTISLAKVSKRGALLLVFITVLGVANYIFLQFVGRTTYGHDSIPYISMPRKFNWMKQIKANLSKEHWSLEKLDWDILKRYEPDDTVVLNDIGFVGFLTMNPIWDVAGLVTRERAGWSRSVTTGAMIEKFYEANPVCLYHFPSYLRDVIEPDPRFSERFELDESSSNYLPSGIWRNIKSEPIDERGARRHLIVRLKKAVERFPEYEERALAMIRDSTWP